ncbi:MAG: hypothetical protein J0L92_09490 [Deltaproteobacteria bacterium]|nr:hypothetical protein [Deltaproteobacteria bacterium]
MRTAFRALVTLQSLAMVAVIVAGAAALTTDLSRLPAAIAGASLAVGLFSLFPIATRALGIDVLYRAIARSEIARDGVDAHRPFQFAATLCALGSSAAIRLPAWIADAGPRALDQLRSDLATDGPLKTLWVWGVATLIVSALVLLVVAFTVLVVRESLTPTHRETAEADAARMSLLWNFLAAGVLAAAELPGLFGDAAPVADVRFWIALFLSIALARRVLVLSLLYANDRLGLALDRTLAARALPTRIPTRLTALALLLVCAAQLALDHALGVSYAAAAIVVVSGPLAILLERASTRVEPT